MTTEREWNANVKKKAWISRMWAILLIKGKRGDQVAVLNQIISSLCEIEPDMSLFWASDHEKGQALSSYIRWLHLSKQD